MRRMDKDKITILNDDTTFLDIQLTTNQSGEGIYRLYPSPEDELTFTVYYRKAIVPDPLHPEETLVVDVVDEKDEEVSFYMETEDGEIISFTSDEYTPIKDPVAEIQADMSDPENVSVCFDTTGIDAGLYWYDITLRIDATNEKYTVVNRKLLEIRRREKP